MKKIEFGFSNDLNPTGSFQGIGIRPGLMLLEADYYGAISYEDENYVVAKVTEDAYNRYPDLLNNFIVRRALCDLYAYGSCVLYLDQNESETTKRLETILNDSRIKEYINSPEVLFKISNGINKAPNSFMLAELGEKVIATSILTQEFDKKNDAIKSCRNPISELQISLNNNYTR